MCNLLRGTYSEKYIIIQFCPCVDIIEYSYTNLDDTTFYTPGLYGAAYCS